MNRHQMCQIDLCVELCGRQRTVSQEFLNCPKIHARLEKMRRECVPQCMRMEVVERGSSADRRIELTANGAITQATAALVHEERFIIIG